MEQRDKSQTAPAEEFPVWTLNQAQRALPYIESVVRSIRNLFIEAKTHRTRARFLDSRPGKPDRNTIIEHQDALRDAQCKEDQMTDAINELSDLNIHAVDAVNGIAMIPFIRGSQLAWYVFDLWGADQLTSWRYHHDTLSTRRPMAEVHTPPTPLIA